MKTIFDLVGTSKLIREEAFRFLDELRRWKEIETKTLERLKVMQAEG